MRTNVLIIIPARGGSKGIPRKNLRSLAGKPLIYYAIQTALNSRYEPDVYVTTDDSEIASVSEKVGAKVIYRDAGMAMDNTTLDPVIYDGYRQVTTKECKDYDLIVTLQPTSPLLKPLTLDAALDRMSADYEIDTIISVKENTHLTWKLVENSFVPNYKKRVNRQYLVPEFRETGAFLITRASIITVDNRIGSRVDLQPLPGGEDIDIDTYEDWSLCNYYINRKKILFVVSGYQQIGLGHVYNTLLIANNILNHDVQFLVDRKSRLAYDTITSKNYVAHFQEHDDIIDDIRMLSPDVVINDRLDTSAQYVVTLKESNIKVINFEDLGAGAHHADLVINAIYPEREVLPKHYFGHEYFILRDEFLLTPSREPACQVRKVLLTFGGVDPNNFTLKVVEAIQGYCQLRGIEISIVAGFGYTFYETLEKFKNIKVFINSATIADHMSAADIVFTSAGRTTYEVASLRVPTIVMAQNERELTHFFSSAKYGFLNLGLGTKVSGEEILESFSRVVENYASRQHSSRLMGETDLVGGRERVLKLINDILEQV